MIELASVIRDLRAELEAAVVAADGSALLFEVGPVELEVSVVVERSASAGAKARFWVVDAGTEGKTSSTGTQRVKLTLTPKLRDGGSPRVSGRSLPGEP
ncbi:trypco2 family protein [Catenulispora subtropica]|uniref:Trypsin-co-occurring domain-containing protein n=1 Tax=Catenulispora subtropica TaxID=450798 RepID=A0ABN2SXA7_9ACTN